MVRRVFAEESRIPGDNSEVETVMVCLESPPTRAYVLTGRWAILGRVFHSVLPIEVAYTLEPGSLLKQTTITLTIRMPGDFIKALAISLRKGWYTTELGESPDENVLV